MEQPTLSEAFEALKKTALAIEAERDLLLSRIARVERIEKEVAWCRNDASYKAPEQHTRELYHDYFRRINAVLAL